MQIVKDGTQKLDEGYFNEKFIEDVSRKHFHQTPQAITRFSTGLANRVYKIEFQDKPYVLRINESGLYDDAVSFLKKLKIK